MKTPEEIKKGLECCNRRTTLVYEKCDNCPYHSEEECMRKMELDAIAYIQLLVTQLVNQATEYSQALKITTEQRDALKADILRATDKAHEMQSMLDNDVHPNCDYGLYCDLCDALGDVVAWEHKELLDTAPAPPEEEV